MTENPYRLARNIRGISFKTADATAIRLGVQKTAMIRIRAGVSYALTQAMDEGHCGLPTGELVPLTAELDAPRRWCTEAGGVAWISMFRVHYVTRTEEGLATRIIRFSASTAIATSAC